MAEATVMTVADSEARVREHGHALGPRECIRDASGLILGYVRHCDRCQAFYGVVTAGQTPEAIGDALVRPCRRLTLVGPVSPHVTRSN